MLYLREPVVSIVVKHNLDREKEGEIEDEDQEPFDLEHLDVVFKSTRISIKDDATENIKAAQKKQKRDYDRRHMFNPEIRVDDMVLMKNNNRIYRKGGKFSQKRLGPYTVTKISEKGVVTLKNTSSLILNKKYNVANIIFKKNLTTPHQLRFAFNFLITPDEIVEMILLYALQQSRNSIEKVLNPPAENGQKL